jgi:kumamolisin
LVPSPLIRRSAAAAAVAVVTGFVTATVTPGPTPGPTPDQHPIGGPYAALLANSTDLGPAQVATARLTAALHTPQRPGELYSWAHQAGLSVRWQDGDTWALIEGAPGDLGEALGVEVHDYRTPEGRVFYAAAQQPSVPPAVRDDVTGLGRILSYAPHRAARPGPVPREVPDRGLVPDTLRRTYNAQGLWEAGHTGHGATVVVFAFDGFDQSDLDLFSSTFGLPPFVPEVVGGMPAARDGEATMDLQAIHAVAPGARTVLVNALPTVSSDAPYARVGAMMAETTRRYPGAIWSLSIGWGCDKLVTATDLEPVRAALRAAHRTGTTAFDASGDLAGLECKGTPTWSAPPSADDVGLDAVASVPEMTSVGGTTLSTDPSGGWLDEQAWFDPPLSQGSGGGVSALFERPDWQRTVLPGRDQSRRLTPAVADPFTGMKIIVGGNVGVGGGTSLSAPIWAGLTAVVNDYLAARGAGPVGDLNPLLYRIAGSAAAPAFHDVTLGGNAVEIAGPGFDLVTGVGTPDVEQLARAVLADARAAR